MDERVFNLIRHSNKKRKRKERKDKNTLKLESVRKKGSKDGWMEGNKQHFDEA